MFGGIFAYRTQAWSLALGVAAGTSWIGAAPDTAQARKELLTTEEKELVGKVERLHLETLLLTSQGPAEAKALTHIAATRLEQLGYVVLSDGHTPADATVKIKCEEMKTWEGPERSGGDADSLDSAARLWKGPACQISYRIGAKTSDWRHEVRPLKNSGQNSSKKSVDTRSGSEALTALLEQLRHDDFPYLLATEWRHLNRLLVAIESPGIDKSQKVRLIGLIGSTQSEHAIPRLTTLLYDSDQDIAGAAATALGTVGTADCIAPLLSLMASDRPNQRRAAIIGLGRLAPLYPNTEIVPAMLKALPGEPVETQNLIVRSLGKTTDRRILEPLRSLHRSVLKPPPSELTPELHELKATLGIALDQFDGTHTEE
jgi:hypothetical protein